jgi:hypothetical protein
MGYLDSAIDNAHYGAQHHGFIAFGEIGIPVQEVRRKATQEPLASVEYE